MPASLQHVAGTLLGFATKAAAAASSLWIFIVMCLVCADVVGRSFANSPIPGVAEVVAFSVPTCVFLAIPYTIRTGRFLRADFLFSALCRRSARGGALLGLAIDVAGTAVFIRIFGTVWPNLLTEFAEKEFFGALGAFTAPTYPFTAGIVVGTVLAAAQFAALAFKDLSLLVEGRSSPTERASDKTAVGFDSGLLGSILFLAFCILAGVYLFEGGLDRQAIGLFSIVAMLFLVVSGMHLATTLIVLSFAGIWLIRHSVGVADGSLGIAVTGSINRYAFAVIPLFVLMGLLIEVADVGRDAFSVAARLLRKLRGGLGVATIFANAIFAAITGSSIASATVFTRVAAPEMERHGYSKVFAVGIVAGSSVLGMLIPPSLLLLVYGLIAEVSIGALFTAAIVPGVILATAFSVMVLLLSRFAPRFVGDTTPSDDMPAVSAGEFFRRLMPIIALIVLVLGGIYGGLFTPTESGAVGAAGALVLALLRRSLDIGKLRKILLETAEISGSILFLVIAANLYARMLTLSAIPQEITSWVLAAELGLLAFLLLYVLIVILLGMILDSVSIMLILLPLMLPIVLSMGADPVWFGIVTVVAVEVGLLTPPFGLAVYVVKGTLPEGSMSLSQIFVGTLPFVLAMIAVILLLIVFPSLSLVFL